MSNEQAKLTSEQALAPCPNCLDAVDVQISTNHMVHWVSCVCGVSGPTSVSREVAVKAWNKIFGARPADEPFSVGDEVEWRGHKGVVVSTEARVSVCLNGKRTHDLPIDELKRASVTKEEEPEPEHVCDGGWACHFHDVKKTSRHPHYERIRKALAMAPTPGPWVVDRLSGSGRLQVNAPSSHTVAIICHNVYIPEEVHEANARLIAACDPDTIRSLLAERDELAARQPEPPTDALTLEQLTAAIAYMGCDTDREYTPEAFARDLFAAARVGR